MKVTPVYAIDQIVITLSRAEAEKVLTRPKGLQNLVTTVLANGHNGNGQEAALPPPVVIKSKPATKSAAKSDQSKCRVCGRMIATKFMKLHTKRIHAGAPAAPKAEEGQEEE